MVCPRCGGKTLVIDNSFNKELNEIYRKRVCKNCEHTFYSIECFAEYDTDFANAWYKNHRSNHKYWKKKGE